MTRWMRNLAARIAAFKKSGRTATIAFGQSVSLVSDHLFDNLLYPAMILWLGPLLGGAVMTLASAFLCLWILKKFYIGTEADWFGIKLIKEVSELGPNKMKAVKERKGWKKYALWLPSKFALLVFWFVRKGDIPAFFALNIYLDPFYATAWLHKMNGEGKMTRRDWDIFLASVLVSNGYWTLRSWGLVLVLKHGWQALFS